MKKRNLPLLILLLLAIVFGAGVLELFYLRFEAGDVYPPYSSLRADPLGSSAYFESLSRMSGIFVSRDFRASDKLPEGKGVAYFHLAGSRNEWEKLPEDTIKTAEIFVKMGGRLIITFFPTPVNPRVSRFAKKADQADQAQKPDNGSKEPLKATPKSGKPKKAKGKGQDEEKSANLISINERWGIGFGLKDMKRGSGDAYESLTVENQNEPSLPPTLSWHSGTVITNLGEAWRVIYARDADPVLVERRMGLGALVFSTDSYFLSNEAMQKERHPELLAWLVGASRQVMFDEAHLGITEDPGVAALVRKYRLHGLVAGMLLLAGLFIWKNSAGFGAILEEEDREAFIAGKDSAEGFVNLLRRHIKPPEILKACVAEWRKSLAGGSFSAARIEQVEALMSAENALPPGDRDPVRTYEAICATLKRGPEVHFPNPEFQVHPKPT